MTIAVYWDVKHQNKQTENNINCRAFTETKGTREVLIHGLYLCSLPGITQSTC